MTLANPLSKSQIDRLGERLRVGNASDSDLKVLNEFRASFAEAQGDIFGILRARLGLVPTVRLAKTTRSIVEKLKRQHTKLTQIQDMAGCRVIVDNINFQDSLIQALRQELKVIKVHDRRERTSHGYRAVHVIASSRGKPVEIQVRTVLQHLWAQLSEQAGGLLGLEVKYGGGPEDIRAALMEASVAIGTHEARLRNLGNSIVEGDWEIVSEAATISAMLNRVAARLTESGGG